MTEKLSLSFNSSTMNKDESKLIMADSLEERKLAFQNDKELMEETKKFITEVIETAANEATKRKLQNQDGATSEGSRLNGGDIITGWNNRARGFCNRILNALCPCFTNNELFAWTPYKYRFTRP